MTRPAHNTKTDPRDASLAPGLWTRPGVMAFVVLAAVVYGSLIPFDFAWSDAVDESGGTYQAMIDALCAPRWVLPHEGRSSLGLSFALSDLLTNLLLYLPLGVVLRMAIRAWWRHAIAELAAATTLALLLSWTVESLQSLMPMRVASLNDVLANTLAASIAALAAPTLWRLYRKAAFRTYCRSAGLVHRLRRFAQRPAVPIALAIVNALVISAWYLGEIQRHSANHSQAPVLPFEKAFELPYDLGFLVLGEALLAYAGIGCLLMLLTYTGTQRIMMRWVVLGVVSLAFAAEISRAATYDTVPDITGPLLALSAAAIMTLTLYTFSHAVKRSNRRHRVLDYQGPERRRAPHDYA